MITRRRYMGKQKTDFIIMTSITNPAAMAVAYNKGWAAESDKMWYSEAQNVTSIGTSFYGNTNLLSFKELRYFNLTVIPGRAFMNCTNLTDITLPQSLTTIQYEAFNGCSSLRELTIPENVTSISTSWYVYGCTSLKKMTVQTSYVVNFFNNLTDILEEVVFGDNVTTLGARIFLNFTKLKSITWGRNITTLLYEVFNGADLSAIETLTIPEGVVDIGDNCFAGVVLKNLVLPCKSPVNYNRRMFGEIDNPSLENIYVADEAMSYFASVFGNQTNIMNKTKPISELTI